MISEAPEKKAEDVQRLETQARLNPARHGLHPSTILPRYLFVVDS